MKFDPKLSNHFIDFILTGVPWPWVNRVDKLLNNTLCKTLYTYSIASDLNRTLLIKLTN